MASMGERGVETTTGPLPIGEFAQFVQRTVKQDPMFQHQALIGEVSQWKTHNGNVYFTLRDEVGQMNCVIWRSARLAVDPSIKEGAKVVVIASLDLWPKRGNLQLVVVRIQPVQTLGDMERIKRELIEALRSEGALDAPKRRLPSLPKHVAIVTGTRSAALSDMMRLISDRWPGLRTTVIGVMVQGELAPSSIVRGLAVSRRLADPQVAAKLGLPPVDAVIVGRGGGSAEDLWAFNLEPVVRAVMVSPVPIVSAVGHEQDMLVTDLVADVRASTPSNAVERLVPDRHGTLMLHDEVALRLHQGAQRGLGQQRQRLHLLTARLKQAPAKGLRTAQARLERGRQGLERGVRQHVAEQRRRMERCRTALTMSHPQRVLERGYVLANDPSGNVVTAASTLAVGQAITFHFADGAATADVTKVDLKEDNT